MILVLSQALKVQQCIEDGTGVVRSFKPQASEPKKATLRIWALQCAQDAVPRRALLRSTDAQTWCRGGQGARSCCSQSIG